MIQSTKCASILFLVIIQTTLRSIKQEIHFVITSHSGIVKLFKLHRVVLVGALFPAMRAACFAQEVKQHFVYLTDPKLCEVTASN